MTIGTKGDSWSGEDERQRRLRLANLLSKEKGKDETTVMDHRRVTIDAAMLCSQLDLMVGPIVAEVIINQYRSLLGREDVARLSREKTKATVHEIVDLLAESERLSGIGSARITVPDDPMQPTDVEVSSPCVTGTSGAAKSFIFGYWCGALSLMLKRDMKTANVIYDKQANALRCQIVPR